VGKECPPYVPNPLNPRPFLGLARYRSLRLICATTPVKGSRKHADRRVNAPFVTSRLAGRHA